MGLTCTEEGCGLPERSRGLCNKHYLRAYRAGTLPEDPYVLEKIRVRFMNSVVTQEDGCWRWVGCLHPTGYGLFSMFGKQERANRASMKLFGEDPGELNALHKCDNPWCVCPQHLFAGTCADNSKDMVAKGRSSRGESKPMSKLTEDMVRFIRSSSEKTSHLAKKLNVSPPTIARVRKGELWKHVK